MWGKGRWFAAAVLLLLGWMVPLSGAHAGAGLAGTAIHTCVAANDGKQTPRAMLARPAAFDCGRAQLDYPPGNYWVLSEPVDRVSRSVDPLTVRITSLWQQELALHVLYADGHIESSRYDGAATSKLIQLGAIVEFPVPVRAAQVKRLLWEVTNTPNMRGILTGARIATAHESAQSNLAMAAIYAGFAGLCFALIIYNFALWIALRHDFQLAYCAMATALLLYAVSSSGALAWIMPDMGNNTRLRVNHLLLALSGAAGLVFARTFFEPRVFAGWFRYYVVFAIAALLVTGTSFFFFAPMAIRWFDSLYLFGFFPFFLMVPLLLVRAWRSRSAYFWVFVAAWFAPIATASARVLHNLHFIQWNFWLDNSTILAMSVEALISSTAIAYRMRMITRERDAAMAGEVTARRLAETDPLTGLLNRRAFLERAIGREGDQQLLIADLDHFKRVNDTLGHDGGDEVLRVFARTLRASVPQGALVARFGGEEFAVVTHCTAPIDPHALIARLRTTSMPFDLSVTASIGSCSGPLQSEAQWKTLYRDADAALFEAKTSGRDRARCSDRIAA